MLNKQYRIEKTICEMVSAVTYNGKLVCSENILENPYEFEKPILMALPHFAKSNIIFYHHKFEEEKVLFN